VQGQPDSDLLRLPHPSYHRTLLRDVFSGRREMLLMGLASRYVGFKPLLAKPAQPYRARVSHRRTVYRSPPVMSVRSTPGRRETCPLARTFDTSLRVPTARTLPPNVAHDKSGSMMFERQSVAVAVDDVKETSGVPSSPDGRSPIKCLARRTVSLHCLPRAARNDRPPLH